MNNEINGTTAIPQENLGYVPANRDGAVMPDRAAAPRFRRGEDGWACFGTEDSGRARLLIAGDLICQNRLIEAKKTEGPEEDYDFDSCFSLLRPLLQGADLTIGNLEGVFHPEAPYLNEALKLRNGYNRNGPPQFLTALRDAGFDLLTNANNHAVDTGLRGLIRTCEFLDAFGFLHTGCFPEPVEPRFLPVRVNGIRVGVLAYATELSTYQTELAENGCAGMLGCYSEEQARQDILAARAAGAEFVICLVHWGLQGKHRVTSEQRRIAKELAGLGADYIVGSHPHVVQVCEVCETGDGRRVPVVYSLGNLISQHDARLQRTGMILQLELEKKDSGEILVRDSYIPCLTRLSYHDESYVVYPLAESSRSDPEMAALAEERTQFVESIVGPELPSAGRPEDDAERPMIWEPVQLPDKISCSYDYLMYVRLTEDFRKRYIDFMLDILIDYQPVRTAIKWCQRYTKNEKADLSTHRELIGDMVYARNVLGFYYYEYVAYDLRGTTTEEKLAFLTGTQYMKYYDRLNTDRAGVRLLNNKFDTYQLFQERYKREIVPITGKADRELFLDFCRRYPRFFVKPRAGSLGKGVRMIKQTEDMNADALFKELIEEFKGENKPGFLCEEPIVQHPAMAEIHPESVNSLRIFTYFNGTEAKAVVAWLKAGQGSAVVDNGGAGGMIAAIDCATGCVIADAGDEIGNHYVAHPDTGFVFKGFQVPRWEEAVAVVTAMAPKLPGVRLIGWDVALSEDKGWQIVEGNAHGLYYVVQISTRKGMREYFEKAIEWERWRYGKEDAPAEEQS